MVLEMQTIPSTPRAVLEESEYPSTAYAIEVQTGPAHQTMESEDLDTPAYLRRGKLLN